MAFKKKTVKAKKESGKSLDIAEVIKEYSSEFGDGIFWDFLHHNARRENVPHVATRLLGVNWLFGVGGAPRGRLIEMFGAESSGKTTLAYEIIRAGQKYGLASYIDTEQAFELNYAARCGVNFNKFQLSQPDYGEQAYSILEKNLGDPRFSVIVLDSLASMAPKAEADGEVGDKYIGLAARMHAQEMRRLSPHLKRTKAVVVFINQVRANMSGYGYAEESGGGYALRHALQVRMYFKKREKIVVKGNAIGFFTEITTRKNKVATPFRTIKVPIIFGRGYSPAHELMMLGEEAGVIAKAKGSASHFKIKSTQLGKTPAEAYSFVLGNPKLYKYVETEIMSYLEKKSSLDIGGVANESAG